MRKGKNTEKNPPRNSKGQFVKTAPPPSSLATPPSSLANTAPSSSRVSAPSTPAAPHSSLVSSPYVSSPSDLPGSYPTSQLASPALVSALVDTPSRPATPDGPSLHFPSPPVSTGPPSQLVPISLDPADQSAQSAQFTQNPPDATDLVSSTGSPTSLVTTTTLLAPTLASAPVTSPATISSTPAIAPATPSSSLSKPSPQPVVQSTTVSTTLPASTPVIVTTPQPPRVMASSATGPGAMPAPRSTHAPYFSGQPGDPLADFLHEYDGLASSLGLTDAQKVETILWYVPSKEREFWQTLDGYSSKDWKTFRAALEDIYPDTASGNRYTRTGLQEFVKISARTRIQDEDDLSLYHKRFLQISNPLRLTQKLSDEERNAEFFNGFHPKDRDIIYDRLFTLNPRRSTNRAPNFDETWEAARGYFTHNQFHLRTSRDLVEDNSTSHEHRLMEQWFGKTSPDPRRYGQNRNPRYGHDQFDRDSYRFHNPAPHDSYEREHWQDTRRPEYVTKAVRFQDPKPAQDEEHLSLSDIIRGMHGLSPRDTNYAILYAQCVQRFPEVAKTLAVPDMFHPPSSSLSLQTPTQTWSQPPAAKPTFIPSSAPVAAQQPQTPLPQLTNPSSDVSSFFRRPPRIDGCAFCTLESL